MGIESLQHFIETACPSACVPIDLLEIARNFAVSSLSRGSCTDNAYQSESKYKYCNPFCLVVDGECCLDKLYGGYFVNWVCGGQWNRVVQFLTTFFQIFKNNNINVTVFLNGAFEFHRFENWIAKQKKCRDNVVHILRHITMNGTQPPKVWWTPPVFLRSCLRMVLRYLNVNLIFTTKDHHREVAAYCRSNNCQGLLAEDIEYIVFNPKRYFSFGQLKLTFKAGLETKEYILNEIIRCLNLNQDGVCILAALLETHILYSRDLRSVYSTLYPNEISKIPSNVLAITLADFVRKLKYCGDMAVVGEQLLGHYCKEEIEKFNMCVQYYMERSENYSLHCQISQGSSQNRICHSANEKIAATLNSIEDVSIKKNHAVICPESYNYAFETFDLKASMSMESNIAFQKRSTPQHSKHINNIPDDVMRIVEERHKKGLISPWIFHVLSQGEFKAPVILESETAKQISSTLLYRPLRQMVYGLLFNVNNSIHSSNEEMDKTVLSEISSVLIKEWIWTQSNAYVTPELVPAVHLNYENLSFSMLWFGSNPEFSKIRLQAFLTCLRSNSPLMMNKSYVPQHLLVLCCVLRYIMSNPEMAILQKHELDAFLVQAVDPYLKDVIQLQKMELPLVIERGVHLASVFMLGIEHAVFANDACGSPVPWSMCCPWLFFDGKLFHRKLLKASGAKNLIDLCDNKIDQVAKVERMRSAILEGLHVQFARPPLMHLSERPLPFQNFTVSNSFLPHPSLRIPKGRGQKVIPQGGQLKVAGIMVGCWGPNYGQNTISPSRSMSPQVVSNGGINRLSVVTCVPGQGKTKEKYKKQGKNLRIKPLKDYPLPYLQSVGRGCTVESDSQTIEVNQLIS